jgi:hypothetical protein
MAPQERRTPGSRGCAGAKPKARRPLRLVRVKMVAIREKCLFEMRLLPMCPLQRHLAARRPLVFPGVCSLIDSRDR